jgi:CRISPR-associated protein Csb2
MTVLELSFPAGRYHATPWGRHVNEGSVEWPPSPWRILRALIATWHLKAKSTIADSQLRTLVEKLSTPPWFKLPRATTSHTRHYMPLGNEKTTKVFDTFIQIEEGSAIFVVWDTNLTDDESSALKTLAERLGYFGRAESLVIGRLLEDLPENIDQTHSTSEPLSNFESLPPATELVRVLASTAPADYDVWRDDFTAKTLAALGPKPTAAQKKKLPKPPEDLFSALHADTSDLQAEGWNLPPGAQFVNYVRREDAFAPATRPRPARRGPLPMVARYSVVSAVAPRMTQGVSVGDRVHDALCSISDQGRGRASVFTGLDTERQPLPGHQHAHILWEANGESDAITHITVWAPMGFDEAACLALRRLNKVWGHGGHDLRLVLHALGQPTEFPDCKLFGPSASWRSVTPFVSTRHAKTYRDGRPKLDASGWQQGSAAHDLLRHLAQHLKGTQATIRQLDERERPYRFGCSSLRSLQFQTRREGGGARGNGSGSAFEINFSQPVPGPIALGYGAHFGLGLFIPS